ncbi:hypothetical protein LE181_17895 [Streptomyces sp. SCA3-4]|uniref:hypothetical protein n=1 Tax=Streptomyces sichuanensis TaxID=2871810 RepID=UPI001CE3335C|nr:hypothetical protein [Streptomyces sichuanensis]MCA6094025.1 hypothetical protein [Streptomyces sichuanensis]
MTSSLPRVKTAGGVVLERLLAELRAAQPGGVLAEQRHQFLDLDPDLVRDDYTRPAALGESKDEGRRP